MLSLNPPMFAHLHGGRNASLGESVPAEIVHMIDPYWYQWPPMEPFWFGIIGFVITILGIMSLSGNFIVIYIFTSAKSLRTPSNMFVVNLAFSDFMMMFTMFPPVVVNGFYGTWILGPFWCEMYGFFGSLFGCVSIWSMTLIAYDRYCVIVKGISRKPLTITSAIFHLLFVWAFCLMWAVFPLVGWNRYVPEGNMTACGTDYFAKDWYNRSYIMAYTLWVYVTPLMTIILSYWHIMKVRKRVKKKLILKAGSVIIFLFVRFLKKKKSISFKLLQINNRKRSFDFFNEDLV